MHKIETKKERFLQMHSNSNAIADQLQKRQMVYYYKTGYKCFYDRVLHCKLK